MAESRTPTVVLGVTGCIAAYKACELARELMRDGVRVKVVMTENATRFVGATTFRALTREPVAVGMWDEAAAPVHHVSLAEEAGVLVIAPCTANVLAKLATGRADDLLTTTALACRAPLVIAPAMNVRMWRDEATQANVAALRARGAIVVEPESGELACGDVGEGRLAAVDVIADEVRAALTRSSGLAGVRMLVTAGPTVEPIDAVRHMSNRSSGKQGYAIAEEAARRGASVTLVSGPTSLPDPFGVEVVRVGTALEMEAAVSEAYDACDVVIATAAVSDFRPAETAAGKVKKEEAPDTVRIVRTPDILAGLGSRKGQRVLVGFAAETSDVVAHARMKLAAKNLDLVVANDVSAEGLGFGSDRNAVVFVTADDAEDVPACSKRAIARELLTRVARLLAARA
ncbi:MAG: bifunctional phosphopantothenoylcysteine decarboxylase/phosphopantothenate--cysteine ligase CoaBC [Actinobacteria bacterium]|nr:MAG: bifunctional phosphopantothenoylcysteine decarboxylase/phosphopantothenate--cysteine ligase CoaBC [Actinomycetota bacterium]